MRRSDEDDEEYSARYPSANSTTQWASYVVHPHGVTPPSSNMRYSGPGVDSGYESGAGSSGQGVWMPHGSSYTGGSYPRQDRNPYDGYHSSTSQRAQDHWTASSGSHGRHSVEPSTSRASTSQTPWEPHHDHNRTTAYPPYTSSSTNAAYYNAAASSSSYHASSSTADVVHNYAALPSTPQATIESYLTPVKLPDTDPLHKSKRAYQCTWQGCPKAARGELFKSKDNARVHVHKHFGSDKLFECVVGSCKKRFASEDAAKRHRDTTESKAFSCGVCSKVFARKDYRDLHQRRCTV